MKRHLYFILPALLLILSIKTSFFSDFLIFNDEMTHYNAASFYVNEWLPPKLSSEAVTGTRCYNGTSYLDYLDFIYFFYGKIAKIGSYIGISNWQSMRILNIILLIYLFLYIQKSEFRKYLIPSVASAAVFYSFTYINSDGISHLISVILIATYLKQFRNEKDMSLQLGILSGLLLCCKLNYFPIVYCICLLLFWNCKEKINFKKYLFITISILAGRYCLNFINNDFDWQFQIAQLRELHSTSYYGPYKAGAVSHWNVELRAKGFSIFDMLKKYNWFSESINSMFIYGYQGIYNLILPNNLLYLHLTLFAYLSSSFFPTKINKSISTIIFFMIVCVGISLYRSWTFEFQPQGRYLFPLFPLFTLLSFHIFPKEIPKRYENGLLIILTWNTLLYFTTNF